MTEVRVHGHSGYTVYVGGGALTGINTAVPRGRCAVIADKAAFDAHGKRLVAELESAGSAACVHILPRGEAAKTWASLGGVLEFMAENELARSDTVVSFGGGTAGDVAGLAASLYMRGIRLVHVPTTLLAAIDSAIGGKCAVNLKSGKNLAGAFYRPSAVICDTDVLATLPEKEIKNGAAEVLKYGILEGGAFFADLLKEAVKPAEKLIAGCVRIKAAYVEKDELDCGARILLNLGHTAAHAVEKLSAYKIPHGRAVAVGLRIVSSAAERYFNAPGCAEEVAGLLRLNGIDASCPYTAEELAMAAMADKKRRGDKIILVMPFSPGDCRTAEVPCGELRAIFKTGLET